MRLKITVSTRDQKGVMFAMVKVIIDHFHFKHKQCRCVSVLPCFTSSPLFKSFFLIRKKKRLKNISNIFNRIFFIIVI